MPRNPATVLTLVVAAAAIITGGCMMAGLIGPTVEPALRFAFGGVLVLYGLYRVASVTARSRADDGDDEG